MIKQAGIAIWLGGIALLIAVTVWSGLDAVGRALGGIGWGVALVVLVRAAAVATAGAGWWLLFPPMARPWLRISILLRFIREAANVLLPVAQVGGDVIGAGLLRLHYGVAGALAAASIIVDILMQAATQFLFAAAGLIVLIALDVDAVLARIAAIGLAIGAVLLLGFYLAQQRGGQRALRAVIGLLAGAENWRGLGTIDAVYQNLADIYAARARLALSGAVHMAGWFVGVGEVLVVFACLGHPVGIGEALAIESLLHAVRGAAFAIPGALGAQEGALVLICAAFGIAPSEAIALSLVKRAADLVVGAPGLLVWQALDWGRRVPIGVLRARHAPAPIDPRR